MTNETTDNTDEPTKAELHDRVEKLESTVAKMMPSRRDALRMGVAGIVGAAGLGAASQSADASTGAAGTIGSTSDRPDLIADDVGPRSLAGNRLFAAEFSGGDADARLDNCLNAASPGDVVYLEADNYTQNQTITTRGLRLVGVAAVESATGISGTITLSATRTCVMHVSLRDNSFTAGKLVLDGGVGGRHLAMNLIQGELEITSGTKRSIVAFARRTAITNNGSGNALVGNV